MRRDRPRAPARTPGKWLALALAVAVHAAFIGVLIMVRPGAGAFEPAAFFALYSALGYAYGQMIGRPLAQKVSPLVIATWQNTIYLLMGLAMLVVFNSFDFSSVTHKSLVFLSRPWVWPPAYDALVLTANGVLAARFDHEGRLCTAGRDRKVRLWDAGGKELQSFAVTDAQPLSAALSFDGKKVIGGDTAGNVHFWSLEAKK